MNKPRTALLIAFLALLLTLTTAAEQPPASITILTTDETPSLDEEIDLRFSLAINDVMVISYRLDTEIRTPAGTTTTLELIDSIQGYKYGTYTPKQPGTHTIIAKADIGGTTITQEKTFEARQPGPTFNLTIDETTQTIPLRIAGTITFHKRTNTTKNVTLAIKDHTNDHLHPLCTVACKDTCTYTCYTEQPLLPLTYTLLGQHTPTATPTTATFTVLPGPSTSTTLIIATKNETITNKPHNITITISEETVIKGTKLLLQYTNNATNKTKTKERFNPERQETIQLTLIEPGTYAITALLIDTHANEAKGIGTTIITVTNDDTLLLLTKEQLTLHHDPYYGQYWLTTNITPGQHRQIVITGYDDCPATTANAWTKTIEELTTTNTSCTWQLPTTTVRRLEFLVNHQGTITTKEAQTLTSKIITTPLEQGTLLATTITQPTTKTYRAVLPLPQNSDASGVMDHYGTPLNDARQQRTTLILYTDSPRLYTTINTGSRTTIQPTSDDNKTSTLSLPSTQEARLTIDRPPRNTTAMITNETSITLPADNTLYPYTFPIPTPSQWTIDQEAIAPNTTFTLEGARPAITHETTTRSNGTTHHITITTTNDWQGTPTIEHRLLDPQTGTIMRLNATTNTTHQRYDSKIDLASIPPGTYVIIASLHDNRTRATTASHLTITNPRGGIGIDKPKELTALPGEEITITHQLTNLDPQKSIIINLLLEHDLPRATLYQKEGDQLSLLKDQDQDGMPDTGTIPPGGSTTIIARMTTPATTTATGTTVTLIATSKDHNAKVTDTITYLQPQSFIIPTYHDLAISSITKQEGTAAITIRNNDNQERRTNLSVTMNGQQAFRQEVTVAPQTTQTFIIPITTPQEPLTITARLEGKESDYPDLYPQNNHRTRYYSPAWTQPHLQRMSIPFKEVKGKDHDKYHLRAAVELPQDALLETLAAVLPITRGTAQTEPVDITYLSFNTTTKTGFLLLTVTSLPANFEGDLYLYFDTAKQETPIIQQKEPGIIIDNADNMVRKAGMWVEDYIVPGYYKANYLHDFGRAKGEKTITIRPSQHAAFTPSTYEIYAYHPQSDEFSTNAHYQVTHTKGTDDLTLNQRIEGSKWRYLGFYDLDEQSALTVTNTGTNGLVVFDAIKILNIHQYTIAATTETRPDANLTAQEPQTAREFRYAINLTHENIAQAIITLAGTDHSMTITTAPFTDAYHENTTSPHNDIAIFTYDGNGAIIERASIRCSAMENKTAITTLLAPMKLAMSITCGYDNNDTTMIFGPREEEMVTEPVEEQLSLPYQFTIVPNERIAIDLEDYFMTNDANYTIDDDNQTALNISLNGTLLIITAITNTTSTTTINISKENEHSTFHINVTTTTSLPLTGAIQGPARVGEPVKWLLEAYTGDDPELPIEAEVINVRLNDELITEGIFLEISGNRTTVEGLQGLKRAQQIEKEADAIATQRQEVGIVKRTALWFDEQKARDEAANIKKRYPGIDLENEHAMRMVIERGTNKEDFLQVTYETPAPRQEEEDINKGALLKRIKVYSDVSMHYHNITTAAALPETPVRPRLYHLIDGIRVDVTDDERYGVSFKDTDNNGLVDQASWIVPQLSEQYFEFGLASINTKKSLYRPGEIAEIIIVVLDNEGRLISDADVRVNVTEPDGTTTKYATASGHITQTERGIYELRHAGTTNEGTHAIAVSALAPGVNNSMASYFMVNHYFAFDIIRTIPPTIDPWREELRASITINTYVNTSNFTLTEYVPEHFLIADTGGASVLTRDGRKELHWEGLNNKSVVSYVASLPLITPTMYDIGPAMVSYDEEQFIEARPWYLAVDPILQVIKSCSSVSTSGSGAGDDTGTCTQIATSNNIRPAGGDNALESNDPPSGSLTNAVLHVYFDDETPASANVTWAELTVEWYVQDTAGTCTLEINNGTWHTLSTTCQAAPEANQTYDVSTYFPLGSSTNGAQFRITYSALRNGADRTDELYVDYVNLKINYTVPPSYNTWSLNVSNGAAIKRGTPVKAYAYWNYSDQLAEAYIIHNANGSYENYSINVTGTNRWTNYTFNTSDTTLFNRVGIITAQAIYARDYDAWNMTVPTKNFKLYDDANISASTLAPAIINQTASSTLNCRVLDYQLGTPINDFTVYFYLNGTYKSSKKTNASGWASYNASYTTPASYNISCRIQDAGYYYALQGANSSYKTLTVLDSTPPTITLLSPPNDNHSTSQNITFTYQVTDTHSGIKNCSLYLNGSIEEYNTTINETGDNHFIATLPNGVYNWSIGCFDDSANNNFKMSSYRTLTIGPDTTPPVINRLAPMSGGSTYENVTFRFTVNDDLSGIENCSLRLDGVWNQTNTTIGNGDTVEFKLYMLEDGLHSWQLKCYDDSPQLNLRQTDTWFFTVGDDEDGPVITVITPQNNTKKTTNDLNITYTADDYLSGVENCSLYLNGTFNKTTTSIDETQTQWFHLPGIIEGNYTFEIICYDNSTNNNPETSGAYSFTVNYDYDAPSILLTSPGNGYQDLDGNIDLEYNVSDENSIKECSLLLNGSFYETDTTVTKGVPQYFNLIGLGNGNYTWQVNCTDDAEDENWNLSETRNFSVGPDTNGPTIILYAPSNSTTDSDGSIIFTYSVYDVSSGIDICRLYVDDVERDSDSIIIENHVEQFDLNLPNGDYEWHINCTDDSPQQNWGVSETRTFTVSISYESDYRILLAQSSYAAGSLLTPLATLKDAGGEPISSATAYAYIIRNLGQDNQTTSWYNTSWQRRVEQLVTNEKIEAQENYPLNITLNTATLITDGYLNANCSDLRFANQMNENIDYYFYDADNACDDTDTKILLLDKRVWANRTHSIGIYFNNTAAGEDVTSRSAFPIVDNFDDGNTFPSGTNYWSTTYTVIGDQWNQNANLAYDGTNAARSYISCNNPCATSGGRRSSFSKTISLEQTGTLYWRWYVEGGSTLSFKLDGSTMATTTAAAWNVGSYSISAGTHNVEWVFSNTANANRNAYVDQVFFIANNITIGAQTTQSLYVATLTSQTTNANGNATFSWDSTGQSQGNYTVTGHALKGSYWGDNASFSFSIGPDNQAPTYTNWGINVTNGATIIRGTPVKAYAYWQDNVQLSHAFLEHDGNGTLFNYTVTNISSGREGWANYIMDTANTTEFTTLGPVNVTGMYMNDTSGNTNKTSPYQYFILYSTAEIDNHVLNVSTINEGNNFTVSCHVRGEHTLLPIENYTVTFYVDGVPAGSVDTDATGWANKSIKAATPGINKNVQCVIGDETTIYYYKGSPYQSTRYLNVTDIHAPVVTIFTPANGTTKTTPTHAPSFTVTDNGTLDTCVLYGDWEGGWDIIDAIANPLKGGFPFVNYFNAITFGSGEYTWNVHCNDTAGNLGTMGNATFTILLQKPNVQISSPAFRELRPPGTQTVKYTVQLPDPNVSISNCTLYLDGVLNQTDPGPIIKVTENNFTIGGYLDYGKYLINISCEANNTQSNYDTEYIYISELSIISPANGTQVDRDNASILPDTITLHAQERGNGSDIAVQFMTNHTFPALGVLQGVTIGSTTTNSSGGASYVFNPGSTYYAGNYTWWPTFTWWPQNKSNDDRWFLMYGTSNLIFTQLAAGPGVSYNYLDTITIDGQADSLGGENASVLNSSYGATMNATLISPRKELNISYNLTFNGTSWTINFNSSALKRHGHWNVSLGGNLSSPYLDVNSTSWRTFFLNLTGHGIPTIQLHYPLNDSTIFLNNLVNGKMPITFNWSVNDSIEEFIHCNLTINGLVNTTDIRSDNGTWTTTTVNFTQSGQYNWSVTCSDDANTQSSVNYTFLLLPSNSSLAIYAHTLSGGNATVYEQVNFTANYSNGMNISIVGNCTIEFWDGSTNAMYYNATSGIYTYERNVTYAGSLQWNVTCNHSSYASATVTSTLYVDRTAVDITSPTDGFIIDRDSSDDTIADNVTIVAILARPYPGINISFWANKTAPGSSQNHYLGMSLTNATGHATLLFDPDSTLYAGNYTLRANATYADENNTRYALIIGTLNLTFSHPSTMPGATYTHNTSVPLHVNITSRGPETGADLASYFGTTINAWMRSPSLATNKSATMSLLAGDEWNASILINTTDEKGQWNASIILDNPYHLYNMTWRYVNITKYFANISIWDQYDAKAGQLPAYVGEYIAFYVNYTSNTGLPVPSPSCTLQFGDATNGQTYYNVTQQININDTKTYFLGGLYSWNATCNSSLYETLSATDTIVIYYRTNITITKSLTSIARDNMLFSINLTNNAAYDELLPVYDFIPQHFTAYNYNFGPNQTQSITDPRFIGNATRTAAIITSGGKLAITYDTNATGTYHTARTFIIGG